MTGTWNGLGTKPGDNRKRIVFSRSFHDGNDVILLRQNIDRGGDVGVLLTYRYPAGYMESRKPFHRAWRIRQRWEALRRIALACGDSSPRCRIDMTPNTPVSDLPCRGALQIDHIAGDGRKDGVKRLGLDRAILKGTRSTDGLRLLCQLHQLWDQIGTEESGGLVERWN